MSTHAIDQAIFHVASALQVPVLILALLALALVVFELGTFAVELRGRRGRRFATLVGERRSGPRGGGHRGPDGGGGCGRADRS